MDRDVPGGPFYRLLKTLAGWAASWPLASLNSRRPLNGEKSSGSVATTS